MIATEGGGARTFASEGPSLVLDLNMASNNLADLRSWLPNTEVWYSMKANPDDALVRTFVDQGCGLHVSSLGEFARARNATASLAGPHVVCTDPVNFPALVRSAYTRGVRVFGCDSGSEIAKLGTFAPGADVYIRLAVPSASRAIPTSRVGVCESELDALMRLVRRSPLKLRGFTFHVGSNAESRDAWGAAVDLAGRAIRRAEGLGHSPTSIDLGGGLPANRERAAAVCETILNQLFASGIDNLHRSVEPGRFLVASCGTIVSRVIGTAVRGGRLDVHLDVGVYNGLHEATEGMTFAVRGTGGGRLTECRLLGPTCSGQDVVVSNLFLPKPEIGDVVLIESAGAYTSSAVTTFCDLPQPRIEYRLALEGTARAMPATPGELSSLARRHDTQVDQR